MTPMYSVPLGWLDKDVDIRLVHSTSLMESGAVSG